MEMENSWYRSAPDVLKVEAGWRCISYAKLVWSFFMDYVFCVWILWRVHSSQKTFFKDVFLKRPVAENKNNMFETCFHWFLFDLLQCLWGMEVDQTNCNKSSSCFVRVVLPRFSHGKRSERGCHVPIGNVAKDDGTWICVISWMKNFERLTVDEPCICYVCVCVQLLPKIHISVDSFKISMLSKILRFEFASKI